MLRPGTGRLVIDLSRVTYADAAGLAVLVGTGRRAGLLGGFLRLAAPAPAVAKVLRVTGLDRQLDVFPAVQAAITSPGVATAGLTTQRTRTWIPPPARCTPNPRPGKPRGPGAIRRSDLPELPRVPPGQSASRTGPSAGNDRTRT